VTSDISGRIVDFEIQEGKGDLRCDSDSKESCRDGKSQSAVEPQQSALHGI
jgi:hypothetical protein